MKKEIYSKVQNDKLLACIIRKSDITNYRQDISPDSAFIQVSARKFNKKIEVLPHKHLEIERVTSKTQETWIIIEGKVTLEVFDLDDKKLYEDFLKQGDCAVLFNGGHSLTVEDNNTIMYEVKNGPYYGKQKDKVNI